MDFRLEICTDNIESAVNAETAGADRIELCANLSGGGTTPSYGMILSARDNLSIDLNVMIRPREGDFLYSGSEFDIMLRDIEICGECGVNGVVLGILRDDGEIDTERTAMLTELAYPMSVTFHRAFDMCADPFRGLQDIISAGAARLLTSGQKNKAPEGAELIAGLVKKAGSRIIIMPGSGLNETNISDVARITGASEFHLSAGIICDSEMRFRRDGITMGGSPGITEFSRIISDPDRIKKIVEILKML